MSPTSPQIPIHPLISSQAQEQRLTSDRSQRLRALIDLKYAVVPTKPGRPKQLAYRDNNGRRTYTERHFSKGEGIAIRTGRLDDGSFLCRIDLDSHRPDQDAQAAYATIVTALGATLNKCAIKRSTSGSGIDVLFKSAHELPNNQPIYINGQHVGELFCEGGRVNVPDTWLHGSINTLDPLTEEELAQLLKVVSIQIGSRNPTSWTARKREGQSLIRGHEAIDIAPFLDANGMPRIFQGDELKHRIARDNWRRMNDAPKGARSNKYAGYVQSLLLLASKAYGLTIEDKCRTVAAIAIATNPKARDEHYDAIADTAVIIAKILHNDAYTSGTGRFTCPYWADSYQPPVQRPSGRPTGDRQSKLQALRRLLRNNADKMCEEQITLPGGYRVKLTVGVLAQRLKVTERSVQRYLAELEANDEIVRRQVDGHGGQLLLVLTDSFAHPKAGREARDRDQQSNSSARRLATKDDNNPMERVTESVQEGRQTNNGLADGEGQTCDPEHYILHRETLVEPLACGAVDDGTPIQRVDAADHRPEDRNVGQHVDSRMNGSGIGAREAETRSLDADGCGAEGQAIDPCRPVPEDDHIEERLAALVDEGRYPSARLLLKRIVAAEYRGAWESYLDDVEDEYHVVQVDRLMAQGRFWDAHLEAACIRDPEVRREWRAYASALYWRDQNQPEERCEGIILQWPAVTPQPLRAAA